MNQIGKNVERIWQKKKPKKKQWNCFNFAFMNRNLRFYIADKKVRHESKEQVPNQEKEINSIS